MASPAKIRERPILFSGQMVRAILAGRKTQTRRVLKGSTEFAGPYSDAYIEVHQRSDGWKNICPFGVPGDRLWVRETFIILDRGHWWDSSKPKDYVYSVPHQRRNAVAYRSETDVDGESIRKEYGYKWKPSIFMPRWASRLTLEVVGVKVERLNDISDEDAKAEGVDPGCLTCGENCLYRGGCGCCRPAYRDSFINLWDRINGKRHPWASNPWVWAIEFRRVNGCPF